MGKLRPKVYLLPESVFKNSNACLQLSFSCVSLCKFLLLSQKSTVVSLFNTSFSSTAASAFMFKDYQSCTALVNSLVVVSRLPFKILSRFHYDRDVNVISKESSIVVRTKSSIKSVLLL